MFIWAGKATVALGLLSLLNKQKYKLNTSYSTKKDNIFKNVHLDCNRHDHKQVHQTVALGSFPLRGKTQICFVTGSPNKRWELGLHVIYQQEFISKDSGSLILKIQMRWFFYISGSKILKNAKARISKFSGMRILKYLRIEIPEIFKDSNSWKLGNSGFYTF